MKKPKPPKILDAMVSVVLAYRPKPKTKSAKKRKKRAAKIAKAQSSPDPINKNMKSFER